MLILILGDCHGHLDEVHHACAAAQQRFGIEAAIQVGDFGFFPQIIQRLLQKGARRFPVPLHVIEGNHEDHAWLTRQRSTGAIRDWEQAQLYLHERGTTCELDHIRFGFLGGALHADRRQEWEGQWDAVVDGSKPLGRRRIPKDPAWANWVTDGDVDRAIAAFTAAPPDVLVTHSCPAGIGIGIHGSMELIEDVGRFITRAGFHAGEFSDCGEGGLTRVWNRLAKRPPLWLFGHFHQVHERTVGETRFLCAGSSDDSDGVRGVRPILYDTVTNQLDIHVDIRL